MWKGEIVMKPFNLEEAKAGAKVCTRDGRKVRIICFDAKVDTYKIVALVEDADNTEYTKAYTDDGSFFLGEESDSDLMMATIKREGWINIYSTKLADRDHRIVAYADYIYKSEADTKMVSNPEAKHIATIKIEWEE